MSVNATVSIPSGEVFSRQPGSSEPSSATIVASDGDVSLVDTESRVTATDSRGSATGARASAAGDGRDVVGDRCDLRVGELARERRHRPRSGSQRLRSRWPRWGAAGPGSGPTVPFAPRGLERVAAAAFGAGEHGRAGEREELRRRRARTPTPRGRRTWRRRCWTSWPRSGSARRTAGRARARRRPRRPAEAPIEYAQHQGEGKPEWSMNQSAARSARPRRAANTRPPASGSALPGRLRERTISTLAANAP